MKKERNYTIDFYRFLFALGFVFGHIAIVSTRSFFNTTSSFTFGFDTLLVFIALAGYFLMDNFKRQQQASIDNKIPPVTQAWTYLKGRIRGMGPWFLLANLLGFIALRIWKQTPILQWFDAFLNHLGEFFGLMLTGFGMGTPFDGMFGEAPAEIIFLCQPVWFISGLFICSYLLYFLLARNEKVAVGIIVPFTTILFWGSLYITGKTPNWPLFWNLGDFTINLGLIDMFCSLGIGCVIWTAVNALKDKKFTKPVTVVLTIVQAFFMLFIPFRTLVPLNLPGNPFTFNWGPAYIICVLFTFLLVLNKDGATKVLNHKVFGYLGGLAMYVYMLHWPFIIGVYAVAPSLAENMPLYILIVVVLSFATSILAFSLNKKLQAWLRSEPWFVKETADSAKG